MAGEGVVIETSGVERKSLNARTWARARKIRAEVSLRNKMADVHCRLNFSNYVTLMILETPTMLKMR